MTMNINNLKKIETLLYFTERLNEAQFDYTEWQRNLFKDVPLDEFLKDAMDFRKSNYENNIPFLY